jgi:dTDP-4-amino-4,6-dideoxygalactose transaminase
MDALQCALLRVKLPRLGAYTASRQANAAHYTEALSALKGVSTPAGCDDRTQIVVPTTLQNRGHIWNQYTLRVKGAGQRDSLREFLTARKIGTEIYYPLPLHRQECFAKLAPVDLPVTDALAGEVLSIPVFPELNETERSESIERIKEWLT